MLATTSIIRKPQRPTLPDPFPIQTPPFHLTHTKTPPSLPPPSPTTPLASNSIPKTASSSCPAHGSNSLDDWMGDGMEAVAGEGWKGEAMRWVERVRGVVDTIQRVTRAGGRVHVWVGEAEELLAPGCRCSRRLAPLELRHGRLCRRCVGLRRRQLRRYPNTWKSGWLQYSRWWSRLV